jgi:hypothetical protein
MMATLASVVEQWASIYANHPVLRTGIAFAHVGALLTGAGSAIVSDRAVLALAGAPGVERRRSELRSLQSTHRMVVFSLIVVVASGVLLFAADADAMLHSVVFWIKMALVALLVANGLFLIRAETHAIGDPEGGWSRVHLAAVFSLSLWFLTTLAGVALPNIG